jgi:hypothetical protein
MHPQIQKIDQINKTGKSNSQIFFQIDKENSPKKLNLKFPLAFVQFLEPFLNAYFVGSYFGALEPFKYHIH